MQPKKLYLDDAVFSGKLRTASAQHDFAASNCPTQKPSQSRTVARRGFSTGDSTHIIQRRRSMETATLASASNLPAPPTKVERGVRKRHISSLTMVAAVFIFLAGSAVVISGIHTNKKVTAQANDIRQQVVEEKRVKTPDDETNSGAVATASTPGSRKTTPYIVPADQPKLIQIDKIRVNGRIKSVGLDGGAIAVPKSTSYAGWYTGSSRPGEDGATVMVGHVSGYYPGAGVFGKLKKIAAGDTFRVTMGDDRVFSYRVEDMRTYPKDSVDMIAAMKPIASAKAGLNLITCAGTYDSKSETYDQRLVVFAVQI